MLVQHKLNTKSINFKNAFIQAKLPEPIYLELSGGYSNVPALKGKILEVYSSIYGNVRTPQLWYNHHISQAFTDLDFEQSS